MRIVLLSSLALLICTSTVKCQDVLGLVVYMAASSSLTAVAQADLYVSIADEVERPFLLLDTGIEIDTLHFSGEVESGEVRKKNYQGAIDFFGLGYFQLAITVGQRAPEITNMPNSATTDVVLLHDLVISPVWGGNSNVIPSNDQWSWTSNNGTVTYDPGLVDPDGDSLHVELLNCSGAGYSMPTNAEIDMSTGVLTFTPTALGRFTVCVKVEEWHRSDLGEVAYAGSVSYEVSIPVESLVSINEPTLLDRVNMHYDHAALSIGFVANGVQGSVELRVYDGLGRLVVRDEIIPTMPFSVSDLPKGAYTATLNSQSGTSLAGLHFIR